MTRFGVCVGTTALPEIALCQRLIAVVGVDVEAEDGIDFDGLRAAGGGAELPTAQGEHDLVGHGGGAGFEHLQISQVAGGVELAFDYDAGAGKICGKIGAKALWSGDCSGVRIRCRIDFGELHYHGADCRIDVDGVVVARELAVEIKRAAGARCGDDGDGGAGVTFYGRTAGKARGIAVTGIETGQRDDGAAAANVHTRGSGCSGGRGAGAAGARCGRDSTTRVGVGAAACA